MSEAGVRLTTVQLCYPRFILPELNTHRVFSRNTRSERAVPVKKMVEEVINDPYVPASFGRNQRGMQAERQLEAEDAAAARDAWLMASATAAAYAELLDKIGVHKQHANRVLSPYTWAHTLVTATEWDNFFELRDHPDAQPEIQELARAIRTAMDDSEPKLLTEGQWHVPYVTDEDWDRLLWSKGERAYENGAFEAALDLAIHISVARCARVSYLTHDGKKPSIEDDLALYERLVGSRPLHASPAEHQATPDRRVPAHPDDRVGRWSKRPMHGNLTGWIQYRKMLEQEAWKLAERRAA